MDIECLGHDAFDRIGDAWAGIESRNAGPDALFAGYRFCKAIFPALDPTDEPLILVARDRECIVAVWPLVRRREQIWTVLRQFGDPVSQYTSVLVDRAVLEPSDAAHAFLSYLKEKAPADVTDMLPAFASSGLVTLSGDRPVEDISDGAQFAPMVDVRRWRDGWDGPAPVSRKMRKEFGRKRRRLEAHGPVVSRIVGDPGERLQLIDRLLDWKMAWLKERGLVSIALLSPGTVAMLYALARDAGSGLVLTQMTVGGQPAAAEACFTSGTHCFAYLAGYNPAFQADGPGSVHTADVLAMLAGRGIETYDLLHPLEGYKLDWAHIARPVAPVSHVLTPRGRLHAALSSRAVRQLARHAWHALPKSVRQPITRRLIG